MKNTTSKIALRFLVLCVFIIIPFTKNVAQDFQRVYGTSLDNSFSKVIKDGSNYYVLGQNETSEGAPQFGTVTRLDANGLHLWTLESNLASVWNDGVLTPTGDLLVVGSTLPLDASSKSLIGLVTPAGGGNFTWLRSYLEPGTGKNEFTRIIKNSTPQSPSFPYYILGTQSKPGLGSNDVVLLNINSNGTFNWKKKFESSGDNDFARDLELFSGGQMILAGNNRIGGNIGTALIFIVDNTGTMLTGVQIPSPAGTFTDVAISDAGDIYATLTTLANKAHVMKFSSDLGLTWAGEIPQLTAANQIWEGQPGDAYLTGRGTFGGISRGAVVMMTDIGSSLIVNWLKYLNSGSSFNNGSSWLMPNGQIAFTDGRNISAGFGQDDAFISLSDLQFNTCQVSDQNVDVSMLSPLPDGPILPLTLSQEIPVGTDLTIFQALNWEQAIACSPIPCTVDFTYVVDCGLVTFAGQSSFPTPTSWSWTFAGGSPSNSASQNPVVSFAQCDSYKVCLTVTGGDPSTSCSVCHTVTIVDTVPPVALCLGIGVTLDANCNAVITPQQIDDGSSDDCLIQSMSVSPNMVHGCGLFPVTLTVTDWCGNTATCTTLVQANEDIPPMIRCPSNVTVTATSPAPCSMVVNNLQPTNVSDNCSTPTVTYNITGATTGSGVNNASGLTFNQGVSTITYTATDACGNSTSCSFTVTVKCEMQQSLVHCGQAVITCFSGFNTPANYWSGVNVNGPVMALIDVRDHSTATPGTWWTQASASEYADPSWTPQNLGQVFGIAIDQNDDIYIAASSIYTCSTTSPFAYNPFTAAGPGAIYKVSGTTGLIIGNITNTGPFTPGGTTIPNNGSALGDIGYDASHNQLFVTNHADGMIYRIKNGLVMSRFDPFGSINPPASGPGGNPDFVARGERTWGVAYYNNRVYFATWTEDVGRPNPLAANEIWSIGLNGVGEFAATNGSLPTAWADGEVLEITIPTLPASTFSNPVSDIAFSVDGKMLLAERTMGTDCGGAFTQNWFSYAHGSRLLEYFFNTGTGQWELTPGHTNIMASNTNLKFRTGETNSGSNSAGGCDYGYASFDPSLISQPDCDQFVWNTGDNLHPSTTYNTYCSQNGVTWVYGMQGIPSAGGTNLNSLLIDFDNNVCTHDKILLGDVEILKCGCLQSPEIACDSLTVQKDSVAGSCCFDLSFGVHESPIQYIEIENLTSGVVFNNASISGSSGLLLGGGPTGTLLTIGTTPHHSIPAGDYAQLIHFCLANITNASQMPQCIVIRWYSGPTPVDGAVLVCTDTLCFYCQPPVIGDTCVYVKNDSIACNPENPLEYCYYFQIQNTGDFNASQVVLSSLPPGYAFKPCPPPNINITSPIIALPNPPFNPGIEPDSCSPQLCVKIVATAPVLTPTLICFDVGLSSNDSCCHSTVEHCILLEPCCDPCKENGVVVHSIPPVDSCCHSLDILNNCHYNFFTKIELALITPGVIFGSHFTGGPFPSDWINPVSTNTLIQWQHISGSIPNGTTAGLINFCLDGIDQPNETPQVVALNWITTNIHGKDSIACSDTIIFECPVVNNKCVDVLEQSIVCKEDETGNSYYELTITIKNVSTPPHTANEVVFSQTGGPPVTVFPNPISITPLPFGGTTSITTFIYGSGLSIGDMLCFEIRLHDSFSGDNWCCFEGDSVCVLIPSCGDSCCIDYAAFCQSIMNATSINLNNDLCTATLNIGNLSGCGKYIESVNWGDGHQDNGPFNSGSMPMHSYSVSGNFIISFLAIELDSNGLICFEKLLRDTITLNCDELCPNNLVLNPSFENYISCPTGLSTPFTVSSWILPTDGSADYYNSCATSGSGVSVPNNSFGSQTPRTGSAYAGFILQPTNLYREYLEVQLTSSLIAGNSYQVSFYVSLADQARWAIDKFGAYLSNTMVGPIIGAPVLSLTPQIANPLGNFITNKSGWTLVSGTYVAGGGENFLVIGNFYDNISTTPVMGLGGFYQGSYYYIDDVSVCGDCATTTCDSCCTDSLVFDGLVDQGFTLVNNGCSITVTAPQFDSCYWFGTPPYVVGGFPVTQVITNPGGSWTFTFSNSGTYQICVTVFDACQARQMCTDVSINCEGCHCGTFSDMAIRFERGPGVPLTCGGNPVFLSCPPSGYNYTFTGKFKCQGNGCPDDAPVNWQLVGPSGGTVATGSETGNPYFSMSFPNSYFQQAGVYSLILMGLCGSQSCPCVIKFLFDPPCLELCPCTPSAYLDEFIPAVDKGFAYVLSSNSCEACFLPLALNDCEYVEWYLDNITGTPIGTSQANNSFCYTFPTPGTYTVVMLVYRQKADGSLCEFGSLNKSQTITVSCQTVPECAGSVFSNPGFSEGAVKGGLNTGGHSNGWKASSGNPKLLESQIGSLDGWTVLLSGNIDTADILSTADPVCLAKIEGMIRIRIAVNDSAPGGVPRPFRGKPTKEQFDIELYQGNQIKPNSCDGISCYELASVSLRGLPHNEWLDFEIPYDLRDWDALDTCGGFPGVLVRPAMYVTNPFSNDQGGKETFTYIQLDNFCLGGTIVTTEEPLQKKRINIFPNPTKGEIILQFTDESPDVGAIQIIDLFGRLMFSEKLVEDKERYSFTILSLPPGIYFVKILDNGMPVRIEKIIKE